MKYCPEKTEEICRHLRLGLNRDEACIESDVGRATFYEWMHDRTDFADAVKKAEIKPKARCIGIIQKAAITNWQAAAWWLERKYKDEFGQKMFNDHSGYIERSESDEKIKKEIRDLFLEIGVLK